MKKLLGLIIAATVLSTASYIYSQSKENYYEERNPFLVEKRHGAVFIYSYNVKMQSDSLVVETNPFLLDKRHYAVFIASGTYVNALMTNLEAEKNPFLVDKRHGSVFMMSSNIGNVTGGYKQVKTRNIFLEQKRHQ
ncbi:MAG: hypothetical protein M1495_21180 [Bacteroidetes bacterium]|nr:hypothetical protein [Bacteroidota bacterium]